MKILNGFLNFSAAVLLSYSFNILIVVNVLLVVFYFFLDQHWTCVSEVGYKLYCALCHRKASKHFCVTRAALSTFYCVEDYM